MSQLARRCHFGYSFRLLVAAMQILTAEPRIVTNHRLRCFHQQHAHKTVALFADPTQPLLDA